MALPIRPTSSFWATCGPLIAELEAECPAVPRKLLSHRCVLAVGEGLTAKLQVDARGKGLLVRRAVAYDANGGRLAALDKPTEIPPEGSLRLGGPPRVSTSSL